MTRLPCENLTDFINGLKHFYSVDKGSFKEGQHIILHNDHEEKIFEIINVIRFDEYNVLGIKCRGDIK